MQLALKTEYAIRPNATFLSDNAAPAWLAPVQQVSGYHLPYGDDEVLAALQDRMRGLVGAPCRVFPVSSGAAANIVSMTGAAERAERLICHKLAHMLMLERGAPARLSGLTVTALAGAQGKLEPDAVKEALGASAKPAVVSLTNTTEYGTVYTWREVRALADAAKASGAYLHLDGARLANALAATDAPQHAIQEAGVDILSFGTSKNGGRSAEAVIVLNPTLFEPVQSAWSLNGHRTAKTHLLAEELRAYLADETWRTMAERANSAARDLADRLQAVLGRAPDFPVEANSVFYSLDEGEIAALRQAGYRNNPLALQHPHCIRFMTNWSTTRSEICALVDTLSVALCQGG